MIKLVLRQIISCRTGERNLRRDGFFFPVLLITLSSCFHAYFVVVSLTRQGGVFRVLPAVSRSCFISVTHAAALKSRLCGRRYL